MSNILLPTHTHHCRPGDTKLTPIEKDLLDRLGGPWFGPDRNGNDLAQAMEHVGYFHVALGHGGVDTRRWLTTESAKQKKTVANADVAVAAGVTLLSARGGASAWQGCDPVMKRNLADALGADCDIIGRRLRFTVCPHATGGCTKPCVMGQGQSKCGTNELTHLSRTLLAMVHPERYLALTHYWLSELVARHGVDKVLWRVCMADDIRWELVAPGLFTGMPAIAYTKFAPCCRPEVPDLNLRIAYSASERWTDDDIRAVCGAGHTVAVVFDVPEGQIPEAYLGLPVVDGDTHDHLHLRPHGVVLGLSAKGNTNELKAHMRASGFSRQPEAAA